MDHHDVHLTPHKFSLLIVIKYYLKVQDAFAKHQLGYFLMQQLTVRLSRETIFSPF
jgi:hypothetical protein